jgi:hypothetical protein
MASIPLLIAYVAGQHRIMPPRIAAGYAVLFATGLFLSIIIIGTVCALLGRMLGDISPYWQIGVGLLLVWVGYTFLRPAVCSTTGGVMQRFQVKASRAGLWFSFRCLYLRLYCTHSRYHYAPGCNSLWLFYAGAFWSRPLSSSGSCRHFQCPCYGGYP